MTKAAKAGTRGNDSLYRLLMRVALVLIYVIGLSVAGLMVYLRVREQVAASDVLPDFTITRSDSSEGSSVEHVEGEALPVWTGTDPVTVLILAIDERAQDQDEVWRSDTMILATLDPVTKRAGVLSIPRDLWVSIPGYTEQRINTAHALGDAYGHPGGGPALAVETVKYNLGIERIDYYIRLNFQAFIDFVDLIGGIDICVPETIEDELYPDHGYGYDPLYIEAGCHHFYGDMALKYARVRHTSGGDFDRMDRQQQVVKAIMKQVVRARMVPQLAARAPEIWDVVQKSVKLDPNLQLDEIIALANLATQVDLDNDVRFRVIDENCTLFAETPDREQVLIPLRDKVRDVRDEVFWLKDVAGHDLTFEEEAAKISVSNGTEQPGLAYATAQYLESHGIAVSNYDNADRQDYDASLIILNRDKPATARQLLALLGLPESVVVNGSNPTAEYDIVVILGADYSGDALPQATP